MTSFPQTYLFLKDSEFKKRQHSLSTVPRGSEYGRYTERTASKREFTCFVMGTNL